MKIKIKQNKTNEKKPVSACLHSKDICLFERSCCVRSYI